MAEPGPPVSGEKLARSAVASARRRQRYFQSPLLGVDELVFDTTHGPLASARLRRAINYALDRPAIATALGDRVSDRYLPAGIPGYLPRHISRWLLGKATNTLGEEGIADLSPRDV